MASTANSFWFKPTVLMGANAGSLAPVAWSPNSSWLLVEYGAYVYASDAGGIDFYLYDAATGTVKHPNVANAVERRKADRKCQL